VQQTMHRDSLDWDRPKPMKMKLMSECLKL